MNTAVYAAGYVIVVLGIIYIAHLMHIPQSWLIGIVIVLAGLGLISLVQSGRGKA